MGCSQFRGLWHFEREGLCEPRRGRCLMQFSLNEICNGHRELCNCREKHERAAPVARYWNRVKQTRNKTLSKYCAKMHTSDGNDGRSHTKLYSLLIRERMRRGRIGQVRIFITTASGEEGGRWKKAGRDLNVSGTGEIAASTRITRGCSRGRSMAARRMVRSMLRKQTK